MSGVSRYVTVNGLRLHYIDYGGQGLTPLVCIHGLTGNAHNFDPVASILTANNRVISLDVRGRGDSEWGPPEEYNLTWYVRDLAALLDALGYQKVRLLGTSMGGLISMVYAASFRGRVERLALNDIGPELESSGLQRIVEYVSKAPLEFQRFDDVIEYYRQTYPPAANMSEERLAEFCKWAVRQTANGSFTWKMDPVIRRQVAEGASSSRLSLWEAYRQIDTPILVLRGTESDLLTPEIAKKMCEVNSRTEMVEVPNVGHAPFLTEPAALDALKTFFGG